MSELHPGNGSVLVVDDNPLMVNVLKGLLGSQHYQVYISNNGKEALDVLKQKNVDVIICDVMMPEMDGYEFHHHVRGKAEYSHIPFVFLTALSDSHEVSKGKEAGADDYLVKPFSPEDLLAVIKGKLARSRNLRSLSEERYDSYRKKVIHTLSHEFRTPLVAINTGTELLIEQHGNLDISRVQSLLEAIKRGGQRLEGLVNDFMVLQQIEAGIAKRLYESRAAIQTSSELLEAALDLRREVIEQEGFRLEVNDRSEGVKVKVYEPHIFDILNRILNNAVKFHAGEKLIEVHCYVEAGEVVIEIRDRGIGINVERVKEAIDVFGQIDRDKLEQQGGGLGLAIASRYAHIHGGRLDFEKRQGGGSIVSLILPVLS